MDVALHSHDQRAQKTDVHLIKHREILMTNNTSSICSPSVAGLDQRIWQIGALFFPLLGIPGHLIIIILSFHSKRRRFHPSSLYFISMSIVEIVYLLFLFWDWLDVVHLAADPRRILACAFFYPFVSGTGFISILLLIQLNLDRIRIIHRPQQASSDLKSKRVLIKILLTYSTLVFFVFHYYYSLHYDPQAFVIFGQSCRVYKHAQLWFYTIWPYVHLFCRLTPCLILMLCTIYIFCNRCYENTLHTTFLHRQQQTFSLALVLLSVYTFLALIPISMIQIFNQYMWKYELDCFCSMNCVERNLRRRNWKLINVICIMCETSIYTMKFYIKLIFSTEFRSQVKQLIFCRPASEINSKSTTIANRSSLD